jgi:proliferating cell nuclear antigen PCNA
MKIYIHDSTRFATALAVCKEFHEYMTFTVAGDYLKATILDSTHVSVTTIDIKVTSEDVQQGTLSIRSDDMAKTIAMAHGGPVILEPKQDTLLVSLNEKKIEAHLRLFDIDVEDMSIDGYEPECTCTMQTQDFFGVIKDLSTFGDTVSMKTEKNDGTLRLSTSGDVGTFHVDVPASIDGTNVPRLSFATRYINSLAKGSKLDGTVRVAFGEDMPVRIRIASEDITITFFLAPKLEEDEM